MSWTDLSCKMKCAQEYLLNISGIQLSIPAGLNVVNLLLSSGGAH